MTITIKTYSTGAHDHAVKRLGETGGHLWLINPPEAAITDHYQGVNPDTLGRPGTTVEGTAVDAPAHRAVCVNAYVNGANVTLSIETRADEGAEWVSAGDFEWPNGERAGLRFTSDEPCQWRPVFTFRDAVRNVEAFSQVRGTSRHTRTDH
ncbi:MAG TPA: hypothetical protein VHM00_15550 [Caldimonas sp.]|jgi:hypothetical protein|nr:hypothetical protein [Caldimonas sp.]HEX2542486.1 hypothetical protein [Caldimonas sp.]